MVVPGERPLPSFASVIKIIAMKKYAVNKNKF